MISIDEAQSRILEHTWTKGAVRVPTSRAVGAALAAGVASDVDSPPHDKSLVDGYAIVAADVRGRGVELRVIAEIAAGVVPQCEVRSGTAAQIMTGAPLPRGADAVVMLEHTMRLEYPDAPRIRVDVDRVAAGDGIMRRGTSIQRGTCVLNAGHVVRPIDVGLLCEVGHTQVDVTGPVHVAVLATGNELVPAEQVPGAGMIRNSNGPMLCALARDLLCQVTDLGICGDEIGALQRSIRRGLENDVLLLSGGVSAGVLDLVPKVLEDLGVERVFHKVHLKPGKPLWFGVCHAGSAKTLVFGLPGNPVGCLVCFELFVGPALRQLRGLGAVTPAIRSATLSGGCCHRSDRPTYVPAVARHLEDNRLVAAPLAWAGSADQRAVGEANCLVLFPAGERVFAAGDQVPLLLLGPIPPVG